MKKLNLIGLILTALLVQNFAHAECGNHEFEGVFINGSGDHFKFEQADCEHLVVTDLKTQDVFKAAQGTFSLQAKPVSDGFAGFTMKHIPVSIRLGNRTSNSSEVTQQIDFRVTLPVNSSQGLSSPTIDASATLYGFQSYSDSGGVKPAIYISFNGNVLAEHMGAETSIQWGFIEGINFGLNLLADKLGLSFNDYLIQE